MRQICSLVCLLTIGCGIFRLAVITITAVVVCLCLVQQINLEDSTCTKRRRRRRRHAHTHTKQQVRWSRRLCTNKNNPAARRRRRATRTRTCCCWDDCAHVSTRRREVMVYFINRIGVEMSTECPPTFLYVCEIPYTQQSASSTHLVRRAEL